MKLIDLTEDFQSEYRNQIGMKAQEIVIEYLKSQYRAKIIGTASKIGSKNKDIVASVKGKKFVVEVKSQADKWTPIRMMDAMVGPTTQHPLFDDITSRIVGQPTTLAGYIMAQSKNKQRVGQPVGFAGMPGVPRSGRLPQPELTSTDPAVCAHVHQQVIEQFHRTNDNYLAVVDGKTNNVALFFTNLGQNVLGTPSLPMFRTVKVDLYGSKREPSINQRAMVAPAPQTLRVAVKVLF